MDSDEPLRHDRLGTVLNVAPDLHSAIGSTPVLLAAWLPSPAVALFRGRDGSRRPEVLAERSRRSSLIHWHANLQHSATLLERARRMHGLVPQIATVHHVEKGEEAKVEVLVGVVDLIHVPAPEVAATVRRIAGAQPVVTAPQLVDGWDHPRVRPHRPEGDFVVGWCGQAKAPGDRKRLEVLVDALGMVRRRVPGLRLVMQGKVPAAVVSHAADRSVPVEVKPWCAYADRTLIYDELDLYVSPSSLEGGPLPVFEAAARGCPVALTATGLGAELLDAGGGLRLPIDDPEGQARVISQFMALSPAERADIGRATRTIAYRIAGPPAVERYRDIWSGLAAPAGSDSPGAAEVAAWNREELQWDGIGEARDLIRRGRWSDGARLLRASAPWELRRQLLGEVAVPLLRRLAGRHAPG